MLDPTQFEYKASRWKDLYKFLESKGYDVYAPGEHLGDCLSSYVVLRYAGAVQLPNVSSRQDLYDIMVYVPQGKYSALEETVQKLITDLKEIKPLFMPYDMQQDQSVFDSANNGHYVILTYCNYKKN